ncbi:3-keto-L-gulonate-6-phosphate decarboxylase UlaD [Enterococcus sp. BWB1-3]|uniref:3-keto-L-gulonate-6-phosphate decarboxylase UlaD n=1 Tax=unclassified Enterococcus TaxID=2608891 RepID=UPI0019205926|nr:MULTISPECIES: 3-keto-L-gulonate-6-phosphate decarboxylase UlaD [unclassified Enterococcus]MBL1228202.1 3-keto-L-gulonate-6-phosphate decarboxylase UlaD [Enterococcus sp. BWB1-3]MCB5951939.1 3-keto-L-gulonate-6-phosphate decarboxylase UlaD [Enterococcus sp. BWT-B8]
MSLPNLQIALDHSNLASALADIVKVGEIVDIVEVGTILCLQAGEEAIRCIRALYPEKLVVADTKCADAGGTVAKNCADAGADWMTVICCATIPTMKAAAAEVKEVQVELYGDWTYEQAQKWLDAGISQAIYHQSRDALLAGETWGEKDLSKVKTLIDMGFRVSVTGGLDVETLELFKGVDVYTFITGRGITSADDPQVAAQAFKDEIKRIWG